MTMLFLLAGCSTGVTHIEDVYGSYILVNANGSETLVLKQDGTYIQVLVLADGRVLENKNTWRFFPAKGISDCEVVLSASLSFKLIGGDAEGGEGSFGLHAVRSGGKIRLGAGQDFYPSFKRLSG